MLTVYVYRDAVRPSGALDLSLTPLEELAEAALAFAAHQTSGSIWFGYLEGWMLTAQQEALLRPVFRKFECHVVSAIPLSFSHAWQNEIQTIYTTNPNGPSHAHNNGRAVHDGSPAGHGRSGAGTPSDKRTDQDRKARRPAKGRVKA